MFLTIFSDLRLSLSSHSKISYNNNNNNNNNKKKNSAISKLNFISIV